MVGTPARDFEWLEVLGRGCSGVCRKVRDKNGVLMVVKQIDLSFVTEDEHRNAEREARLLSSLSHPNIIRFFDDYIDDEMLHIVMEYAPLGTLKQHLNKLTSFMREPQVLWLFTNIVQGLSFLHAHKVMHRDIKSDNIFICEPFVPKLGDFGVAKRLNSAQPMAVSVVGTPLYLSPELVNGQPYNTKSDIWALGVLLYEMCARRAPFQAGNQGAVIKKILMGEFAPLPKNYSEEVANMVRDCLAQDPARRPSCKELLAQLGNHHEPNGPANDPDSWQVSIGGAGDGQKEGMEGLENGKKQRNEPMWWDWNSNNGFVTGQFRTMYGGTPHLMSPINGQHRGRGGKVGGIQPFNRGRGPVGLNSPLVGQRPTSAPSTPSSAGNATPMGRDLLDFLVTTPAILEGPLQGPLWRHPKARFGLEQGTPELDEKGEDEWLRDSLEAASPLSGHSQREGGPGPPLAFTAVDDLTGWLQQYWTNKDPLRGSQDGADASPRRGSTRPTSSPDYSSRDTVHPSQELLKASFNANKPPTRVLGVRLGPSPYAPNLPPQGQPASMAPVHNSSFQPVYGAQPRGRRLQLGGGGSGKELVAGGGEQEHKGRKVAERERDGIERTASTDKESPDLGLQLQGHGISQHLERGPSMHAPSQHVKQNQLGRKGLGGTLERKRRGEDGCDFMVGRSAC